MSVLSRVAAGNASRRLMEKAAQELGLPRDLAAELARDRPADIQRWAALEQIPPEEDPRSS